MTRMVSVFQFQSRNLSYARVPMCKTLVHAIYVHFRRKEYIYEEKTYTFCPSI